MIKTLIVLLVAFTLVGCTSHATVTPATSSVLRNVDTTGEGQEKSGHFKIRYYPKGMTSTTQPSGGM